MPWTLIAGRRRSPLVAARSAETAPHQRWAVVAGRLGLAAALLAGWHGVATVSAFAPEPARVVQRLGENLLSGELAGAAIVTLRRATSGWLLGSCAGIAIGLALFPSPRLRRAFDPYIGAGAGLPKYALIPWLVLWLGIDDAPKVVLTALLVVFPTLMAVMAGIRAVRPGLVEMGLIVGANRTTIAREILWRAIPPYVLAAQRITVPRALSGTIVMETFLGDNGLGSHLQRAMQMLDTVGVYAVVVEMIVLLVAMHLVAGRIGRGDASVVGKGSR